MEGKGLLSGEGLNGNVPGDQGQDGNNNARPLNGSKSANLEVNKIVRSNEGASSKMVRNLD